MPGLSVQVLFFHEEVIVTMRDRIFIGAALAGALLVGCALAADALKSGPQAGERIPGPFHPLNVTGDDAGQKRCLV